jgi:hypothetical protein
MSCRFEKAWIGRCGTAAVNAEGFCEEHASSVCCSCGAKATRECDHTGIQFVCGYPLCDGCSHSAPPVGNPGWFNLGGGHKPTEEAHAAWEAYWEEMELRRREPQS